MAHVHIVNPLANPTGGSEWHATSIFELLAPITDVTLWSVDPPHPDFLGRFPIRTIGPDGYPADGNIVLLGAYFALGGWFRATQPKRLILVYNFLQPDRLELIREAAASLPNLPPLEISFVSNYLRRLTPNVAGVVNPSPIDISLFQPGRSDDHTFTIGRVSRDVPEKHHLEDPALYRRLVDEGCKVRLLGGTCLTEFAGDVSLNGIELLPAGAEDVQEFLSTLDAFYYRTDPGMHEAWGRVIFEAMACGLPIVAGPDGGYADTIVDGENGFVIDSAAEAEKALLTLKDDAGLRERMGKTARQTALDIYSPEALSRIADFYSR